MIKQGSGGRIINVSSVHEDWPMPGNAAYCLSKGGMRMLTRTAGVELAPHDILVVGVGPGAVATPINLSTMNDPALLKKLDSAIPLGRMAQPGGNRERRGVPGERWRELHDGDHDLRRRRDDCRAVLDCSGSQLTDRVTSLHRRPRQGCTEAQRQDDGRAARKETGRWYPD